MKKIFSEWMTRKTNLSANSVYKYALAVGTTSREAVDRHIIEKDLFDMSVEEIDIAVAAILADPVFIAKNIKGRRMYSNSIKQYRYFLHDIISDELAISLPPHIVATQKTAEVALRVGQSTYRKNLLQKYNGTCVVSGIDHTRLLVASHIKPWSVSNDIERMDVENGLLLSANIDRLFDCGLLTFNNNGRLFISSFVGKENEKRLNISNEMTVDLKASSALCSYLDYHRDILFVK